MARFPSSSRALLGVGASAAMFLMAWPPSLAHAQITTAAKVKPGASATASANATIVRPISFQQVNPLGTGDIVGTGVSPSTITIPASYFGSGSPAPTYKNLTASTAKTAIKPLAAQIQINGAPNLSFSVTFSGWRLNTANTTKTITNASASNIVSLYLANSKTTVNLSKTTGTLNNKGTAIIGIGTTITVTLAKGAAGRVSFDPTISVAYN